MQPLLGSRAVLSEKRQACGRREISELRINESVEPLNVVEAEDGSKAVSFREAVFEGRRRCEIEVIVALNEEMMMPEVRHEALGKKLNFSATDIAEDEGARGERELAESLSTAGN